MPKLTPDEVVAFLTEPGHLVRLATVDPGGAPRVVPIWFVFEDNRVWMTPRERSAWWPDVQHDPRVAIVIDEEAPPYRKVIARGAVEIVHQPGDDDAWRDRYRRIATRYTPEEWADAYLNNTHDEPRALLAFDLDPATVTTWRMPVPGEDPKGIWAARYYHA
ncbi:MAG TPA: pyridoxamine 5'-phosphate oxidase family protein [Acidimicrobiales bacterium]|nr:pyridoxamine 5'-phosphate oxidase family protein [Acidimicrobiales bacterium]